MRRPLPAGFSVTLGPWGIESPTGILHHPDGSRTSHTNIADARFMAHRYAAKAAKENEANQAEAFIERFAQ